MAENSQSADPKLKALQDRTAAMVKAAAAVSGAWREVERDGLSYLYNDQLDGKKREGWERLIDNIIFPAVRQEMAILAQRRPMIEALPEVGQEDEEAAEFWGGLLQYQFDKTLKMLRKAREAILDGKITGWYIGKVYWDDKARWDMEERRWIGEPDVTVMQSATFGMDPNAEHLDDARYVYCRREELVEVAIAQWPDKEEEILEAAGKDFSVDHQIVAKAPHSQTDARNERGTGVGDNESGWKNSRIVQLLRKAWERTEVTVPDEGGEESRRQQTVVITEVYFVDTEETTEKVYEDIDKAELIETGALVEEIIEVKGGAEGEAEPAAAMGFVVGDPENEAFQHVKTRYKAGDQLSLGDWPQRMETVKVPKYPRGRMVSKVNDIILNPKDEDQVWKRTTYPFVIGVNHMLPHVPRGLNAVEMPRGMQDWVNVAIAKGLNWLMHHGDPVDVIEEGTLLKKEGLVARAGRVLHVLKNRAGGFVRQPPTPLSTGIPTLIDRMKRSGQDLAGMHDQALGQQAKGGATATELTILQESTQVGVGLQIIHLDEWLQGIMEQVAELDQMHMKPGDMVRIVGEKKASAVREYTESYKTLRFDVKLKVGTALPHDREREKQDKERLKALFPQNPEVDRMVLEAFEIENVEEVMQSDQLYAGYLAYLEEQQALAEEQAKLDEKAQAAGGGGAALPAPVGPELEAGQPGSGLQLPQDIGQV